MSDITASERRLSAALDRLDQMLDSAPAPAADSALIDELTRQRDEAQARADAATSPDQADLQVQLDAALDRAARIASANEGLIAANRDLMDAQETGGIGPDESRAALEAELAALRAAREAEMAQMSEIMAELERLLADDPAPIDAEPDQAAELQGDAAGLPDAADAQADAQTDAQTDSRAGTRAGTQDEER